MKEGGKAQQSSSFIPHRDENNLDSDKDVLLEFMRPNGYEISYTFFLIPDLPSYQLTGDLAELLPEWLKQICESNGWILESVTVASKYLQCALSASPVVATMQIIQKVRSGLTEQISVALHGKIEMKDGADFWAPGYLLLFGLHPHPSEVIEQYIRLIRRRQTVPDPRGVQSTLRA